MTYNQKKPPDRTHNLSTGLQPTLGRVMAEIPETTLRRDFARCCTRKQCHRTCVGGAHAGMARAPRVCCWLQVVGLHRAFSAIHTAAHVRAHALTHVLEYSGTLACTLCSCGTVAPECTYITAGACRLTPSWEGMVQPMCTSTTTTRQTCKYSVQKGCHLDCCCMLLQRAGMHSRSFDELHA